MPSQLLPFSLKKSNFLQNPRKSSPGDGISFNTLEFSKSIKACFFQGIFDGWCICFEPSTEEKEEIVVELCLGQLVIHFCILILTFFLKLGMCTKSWL